MSFLRGGREGRGGEGGEGRGGRGGEGGVDRGSINTHFVGGEGGEGVLIDTHFGSCHFLGGEREGEGGKGREVSIGGQLTLTL